MKASVLLQRAAVTILLLFVLFYASDYAWLRYRMARPPTGNAFGSVRVQPLLAIPLKDGKIEYEFDSQQPPTTVTCVHSIFGHDGYGACWKVKRDADKPIAM